MPETPQPAPIRGAIKTSLSVSTEVLVAGQDFSIFVIVQNPFETPLKVIQVSTYLPAEFLDVDRQKRDLAVTELQEQLFSLEEAGRSFDLPASSVFPGRRKGLIKLLSGILGISIGPVEVSFGPAIARDPGSSAEVGVRASLPYPFNLLAKPPKEPQQDPAEKVIWKKHLEEDIDRYRNALTSLQSVDATPKDLQAGNSTTRVFTLRSRRALWFKPASYRLYIEVEYEIGGTRNLDTIEYTLQVKASIASMVIGALLGGFGGWITAKGSVAKYDAPTIVSLAVSLVAAAMAVVLFARKKDIQPLIAVEDFWGGVAVGFVATQAPKCLNDIWAIPKASDIKM